MECECVVLEIFRILKISKLFHNYACLNIRFWGKTSQYLYSEESSVKFLIQRVYGGNITWRMTLSGYYEVFQRNFWDIKRRLNSR